MTRLLDFPGAPNGNRRNFIAGRTLPMRIGTDIIAYGLHSEIDFVSEQKPSNYVIDGIVKRGHLYTLVSDCSETPFCLFAAFSIRHWIKQHHWGQCRQRACCDYLVQQT